VLNEGTLVLEGVTLAQVVELVVKVLVDLAGGAVLDQQTTEDTETAHPHNLAVGIVSRNSFLNPACHLHAVLPSCLLFSLTRSFSNSTPEKVTKLT
jgi:hypothetical protein